MGEARPPRGGCPAAAHGAPLWCGRERESSSGLRGISEHPEETASDGAFFSDARACRSLAGGGRGEGLLGRELRTIGGHSHHWFSAFGVGGTAGGPPGGARGAR